MFVLCCAVNNLLFIVSLKISLRLLCCTLVLIYCARYVITFINVDPMDNLTNTYGYLSIRYNII